MDEKVRGIVESELDEVLKGDILPSIEWISQEIPVSSFADLSLGYTIGLITSFSIAIHRLVSEERTKLDLGEVKIIIRRRLPEIIERINKELHR